MLALDSSRIFEYLIKKESNNLIFIFQLTPTSHIFRELPHFTNYPIKRTFVNILNVKRKYYKLKFLFAALIRLAGICQH